MITMVMQHFVTQWVSPLWCFVVVLIANLSYADNASGSGASSSSSGSYVSQPRYLYTLSEAYLRSLLLPDNQIGQSESFITYVQGMLIDRNATNLNYDRYDALNLSQMFDQSMFALSFEVSDVRDEIFQGYVNPNFPEGSNFIFEINRALMSGSQTLLGRYSKDYPSDPMTASSDQDQPLFIRYQPATSSESLDYVVQTTPTNRYSQSDKDLILKYDLKTKSANTNYDKIATVLNQVDYALFSSVDCVSTFLTNQCLPCAKQDAKPHYSAVMYKDIQNSSCTMRREFKDQAWNGMKAYIASLKAVDQALKSSEFKQAIPDAVLSSNNYLAYQRGVSCLISDLSALYDSNGNWYNFFHWSNFTSNPDCTALMQSAGRTVKETSSNGIIDQIVSYFFSTGNTIDESKLSTEGIYVVNIISGYIGNGSSSLRLQKDPSQSLMQALTEILYRMRLVLQAQASRAAVDVNRDITENTDFRQQSLIPDEVYLLSFYMKNYASSTFTTGSTCRYQGLSTTLSYDPSNAGRSFFDLQKSVMLDMVGQSALTSPLVTSRIPFPPLAPVTLNKTEIDTSKQIQFLKYGKYALAARYRKATNNAIFEGVLSDPDDGYDSVAFSVAKLTAQIQRSQRAVKTQIDNHIKTYNKNMNSLIMKRMMLAYIYEYISVSTMSSWRDMQDRSTSICPLSSSEQLKISSTWRTDLKNEKLQRLIRQSLDYGQSPAADQTASIDLAIQYGQTLTQWNELETLRDEAFQLAKMNYIRYLEYKLNEMMLVFRASQALDGMQNSQLVQQGFPSNYDSNDKNQLTYVLVNTVPTPSSGTAAMNDDGSINTDAVKEEAGVPNSTTQEMVAATGDPNCCKTE